MLLKCKAVAERAGLDSANFDLKTFRSTYATRMLRSGFDVRTVQHWMGHKSLETTMRYLVPAADVHERLDQIGVPGSTAAMAALKRSEQLARVPGDMIDVKQTARLTWHQAAQDGFPLDQGQAAQVPPI